MTASTKNRTLLIFPLVGALLLACQFLSGGVSTPVPEKEVTQPGSTDPAADQNTPTAAVTKGPGPIDILLSMRSVHIYLTSSASDGTYGSTRLRIDAKGNIYIKYDLPGPAEGTDPDALRENYEIFVIDGKVYRSDNYDRVKPVDDEYRQKIYSQFHGPYSPAMWLDLLPEGSLKPGRKETFGGFDAERYGLLGTVDGQQISGMVWFDTRTNALVKAMIHVPQVLFDDPALPQDGNMSIVLTAEKGNVQPVMLP